MMARYVFLMCVVAALSACSDEEHPVNGDHVWQEQTDTIEKARQVEQVITDSALEKKQHTEQQLD